MPAVEGEEPGDGGSKESAFKVVAKVGAEEGPVEDVGEQVVECGVEDEPGEEERPARFGFHGKPFDG